MRFVIVVMVSEWLYIIAIIAIFLLIQIPITLFNKFISWSRYIDCAQVIISGVKNPIVVSDISYTGAAALNINIRFRYIYFLDTLYTFYGTIALVCCRLQEDIFVFLV